MPPTAYKRTDQQLEIINTTANSLVVNALAGTGKTSTLADYAKARPNKKILYLAFNKAIVEEAKLKFPSNVKIITAHGLAFSEVGKLYANENKIIPSLRSYDLINALDLKKKSPVRPDFLNLYADMVLSTVSNFIARNDDDFSLDMVPEIDEKKRKKSPASSFSRADILSKAKIAWQKMTDLNDKSIGMTHDGYLKIFSQIGAPMPKYDFILFDEAQDSTPVIFDIVNSQDARKIYVGDPNQSIYGFRGAINALQQINADKTVSLTNSFRFGTSVAGVANMMLAFKGSDYFISGMGGEDSISEIKGDQPKAFISRGNMTILDEAASLIKNNKKIHFIGGYHSYRFSQLMDVYNLRYGGSKINDPFVASFSNFDEFSEYASNTNDHDYFSRALMVKKYGRDIPSIMSKAEKAHTPLRDAEYFLATAHKSKGLEFDSVKLADDFLKKSPLINESNQINIVNDVEEINLAYVAATRARKTLDIGSNSSNIKIAYQNPSLREMTDRKVLFSNAQSKLIDLSADKNIVVESRSERRVSL